MSPNDTAIPVKSVQKALKLLDRVALGDPTRQGVALAALAEEFGWPLNSTHNLLKTLVACGYITQRQRGIYAAGIKCRQIHTVAQCADPLIADQIQAKLREFTNLENEACICSVLCQGQRLLVAAVESTHAVRISHATTEEFPFFAKASGRIIAAMANPDELQQIIDKNGFPGDRWDNITTMPDLLKALAPIRQQGWCELEEPDMQIVAIAVPVIEPDGHNWGTIGAYAPLFRCPPKRRIQLRQSLCIFAKKLAEILTQPSALRHNECDC